ncbi:transcription-repair coupling factor [Thioalkalivibrio denitrificans]|uniref:Transcription-repair-coupling factor n=1 Tax=Thioalkalivibrio denitrificans TaxID=108003 RepID=A0A1V3NHV5_9GAMM|nr:transcription-repair coupling factor [Thioalkalivibrio denitrificans]OOG24523.1 transcription-repair coupling factor [Thioalkalivibrio denitrificans]
MSAQSLHSPLTPPALPDQPGLRRWGRLYGAARALAIARALKDHDGLGMVMVPDTREAEILAQELAFFLSGDDPQVLTLPDWETLPYDLFSPHEDIISRRLEVLSRLPAMQRGILVVPVNTLMQRIAPRAWLQGQVLMLAAGDRLDRDTMRRNLEQAGYHCVSQVMEHGEFAVRGSLVDLFPMGSDVPYRIDLMDDEIETLRSFDPETQRSLQTVDALRLLPAHEFPMDEEAIRGFRQRYRTRFEGDPQASVIYRDVSQGAAPAGIEYYLPLFFDALDTLFDYLPRNVRLVQAGDIETAADDFLNQAAQRYEQRRHDRERPIHAPEELFLGLDELKAQLTGRPGIRVERPEQLEQVAGGVNFDVGALPDVRIHVRQADPAAAFKTFLDGFDGRVLIAAESAGRREFVIDSLRPFGLVPAPVDDWQEFLESNAPLAITVAPIEDGMRLACCGLAVVTESALFGERARQERRRRRPTRDSDAVIRNLTDLHPGAPVVHEEHGVGRYLGLQKLSVGGQEAEFLTLEYAGGDKLYVPVSSLHLVSRYTGADTEHAPLHKLGGEQWARIRRKAAEKARDVAAELLDIYARRAARKGHSFDIQATDCQAFAAGFPFEETPDQARAIEAVLDDMASDRPMDRVVCGDVGFGKTEVAMRAAFVAANSGKQVAVLVPTTLLTQQHFQNFSDRFAEWPIRIETLSRFRSAKEQKAALEGLADGRVDIVIGTHKLIQGDVKFKRLGLVIIDEEHRFGVRHKERLKALRAEVDMLTLTATPIPRTLNMALSGLRDLSIIATPPMERHAIKTFISQWNDSLIQEAITREIRRGGQVYFLHNSVETIERAARQVAELVPGADIGIAHGQMRESELERVMLDFYHRRHNVLVCTTIVESGIDVPTANTIVIDRADKLGLSQLHQLRGRVGRSHHRAYAYLITPHPSAMTADAVKRLEAIESLEDLGVGFTLASHDLEIRGAGELLGEDQSGQIHEIGFTLYNELLERAVTAMKKGEVPDLDRPMADVTEVDLGVPALLPDDYVPDVHTRLILYKRIASCESETALRELQVEMIDRFGLLPEQARNLVAVTELRLRLQPLGVRKLEAGPEGGRFTFQPNPNLDPARLIALIQSDPKKFRLDPEQRLRFHEPMDNLEARIQAVKRIIATLALKQEAA